MKQLVILRAARLRLAEIWNYTHETWGEEQADIYLRELGACMDDLASRRHL